MNAEKLANLHRMLKELHLPAFRAMFEEHAQLCQSEDFDYLEFLYDLSQAEMDGRKVNRIEKFLKQSKIPLQKSLETYEQSRIPMNEQIKLKSIIEGHFVKYRENVLVFGNPGTGKTHLLCAIGQELIKKGYRVLFTTCSLLVQDLLRAKTELRLEKHIKKLSKYDALIIDDIGYVQQSRPEMEVLFTLLAERYERGSLMISSNLPFSQWEQIFKDPMTTAAAIDRVVHHSIILELNIDSYRMEEAQNRKKQH
jgi:DNA replication protein DnaC